MKVKVLILSVFAVASVLVRAQTYDTCSSEGPGGCSGNCAASSCASCPDYNGSCGWSIAGGSCTCVII